MWRGLVDRLAADSADWQRQALDRTEAGRAQPTPARAALHARQGENRIEQRTRGAAPRRPSLYRRHGAHVLLRVGHDVSRTRELLARVYHIAAGRAGPYTTHRRGPIAQRLERGTHNPEVQGSNPCGPTPIEHLRLSIYALIDARPSPHAAGLGRGRSPMNRAPPGDVAAPPHAGPRVCVRWRV